MKISDSINIEIDGEYGGFIICSDSEEFDQLDDFLAGLSDKEISVKFIEKEVHVYIKDVRGIEELKNIVDLFIRSRQSI